jgi:hypothetical protein
MDLQIWTYKRTPALLRQNIPGQSNEDDPLVTQTLMVNEDALRTTELFVDEPLLHMVVVSESVLHTETIDDRHIELYTQLRPIAMPQYATA